MREMLTSIEYKLFYIYFIIMLLTKGLGLTDGPVYKVCILVASAAALLKIVIERHTRKEYAFIAVLLVLCAVNWITTRNQGVLICVLLVLAMKNVRLDDAFRVGAIVWGLSYVVQIATQLLNLRTRDFVIHSKLGFRHIIRWALGYSHPNVLQIATLTLIAYAFYCYHYQTTSQLRKAIAAALAISIYIFIYSISVTGMIMTMTFLFFLGYFEFNRFHNRERSVIENVLLQMIFPVCVLFSVLAPLLLQGQAFELLNKVMTHRPSLSRFFITTYGLLPFGGVFTGLNASMTLDCSYVNLLMNGGYILFAIMCISYWLLIRYLLHQPVSRENSIALAITIYSVVGAMSEPFAFNTAYKNLSLLFMGNWFYHGFGQQTSVMPNAVLQGVTNCANRLLRRLSAPMRITIISWIVASILGITCSLVYTYHHTAPQDIYALRTHSDTVEGYEFLYYTEDEIKELCDTKGAWVLEYKDAESIMILFSGEGIGEIEELRTQISIYLFVTLISYTAIMIIRNREEVTGLEGIDH